MNTQGNHWHLAGHSRYNVRRSGMTKTWKTRPGEFRIPVKFGLYQSGEITHETQDQWHDGSWESCQDCQACRMCNPVK